jgi:hypothetical protein
VVASDRDLRGPSSVGWPLAPAVTPAMTFDAVEALLLDGRPRAALHEKLRRDRVRWVTAAFCAAALLIELALLVALTRSSDRHLDAHLARSGVAGEDAQKLAPKRSPTVVIALALVALGFLVVALAGVHIYRASRAMGTLRSSQRSAPCLQISDASRFWERSRRRSSRWAARGQSRASRSECRATR